MSTSTEPVSELRHHLHHNDPQAATWALAEQERLERKNKELAKTRQARLFTFGRILLGSAFIVSGIFKILQADARVASLTAAGIYDGQVLVPAATALELLGGALIAFGYKTQEAALGLIGYIGICFLVLHADVSQELNRVYALGKLGIISALVMVIAHGAGTRK
jgi:putative oxidoreductase